MKVTKSAIYRLEVELDCTCKAAGEYEDAACKKQKGVTMFFACADHKEAPGIEMLEMTLKQFLDKEARETKLPEAIHPRTAALAAQADAAGEEVDPNAPPARPLRTSGSAGSAGTSSAGAAVARRAGGSHRPSGGGGGGASPFRRTDPSTRMSPQAAKALAGSKTASASTRVASGHTNPSGITFGGDSFSDVEEVAEDPRVTRLLASTKALADDDEDGGDDFDDFEL